MNLIEQIKNKEFVVFDCETTGLNYRTGHQIIELAGQKLRGNEVVSEFYQLINPTCHVDDDAYRVHGLSNLYLAEHGKSMKPSLEEFLGFVDGAVLVGHNILDFDIPFLNANLDLHSLTPVKNLAVDTLLMSRKLLAGLPNHKLGTLANHFNVDYAGAHRAMKDVDINRQVFLKMLDKYMEQLSREQEIASNKEVNHKLI